MDGFEGGLGQYPATQNQYHDIANAKMASVPTMRQRLDMAVKQAAERLKAAQEAREIFDRNPDVERLLDLIQRSNF